MTHPASQEVQSPLVVGVGASAGGLEAFQGFLTALGDAPGFAVVFVQHLDPNSKSLLPELLQNITPMPVLEISGRKKLKPNTVYVSPPQSLLELENGFVRIVEPGEERHPAVIDYFFHSIAEDLGARAIGVILSGGGTDGTLGLKAISDRGGLTFAQEPRSASHDSMPRSAATTGVADHVLVPSEIAAELLQYARHLDALIEAHTSTSLAVEVSEAIPAIVEILLKVTNHNFQHYKIGTLSRRIQRRMQVRKISAVSDYVKHLENHEEEAQTLFRELLIGVTAFFRDPEAFEVLAQTVLPKIFENRSDGDTVRIWVAGCANGAEAYSLAILCCETMSNMNVYPDVQIFASDIDERALQIARAGIYPVGIEEHVSAERLQRSFVKRGKRYQVTKEIRDLVLFSSHNLISDPPFSRQDLICCRNLLIYLGSHLQNKLIPLFHYALRPSGYLFLGPSENITSHGELFRPLDARLRISQRKGTAIGSATSINLRQSPLTSSNANLLSSQPDTPVDLTAMRQRIVLDEFSPKSCVVDENGQILNAAANMQKYLALGDGDFQNNITRLAATGLRIGLRAAIAEAKKTCRMVQHDHLSIRVNGKIQPVMITVQPMPQLGEEESLFLIVFHDVGLALDRDDSALPEQLHAHDADSIIARLERELETTRSDLDRTLQDMEAANEELKSSNEELLSMNEELQSANEELETSKEEIRAGSDALATAIADLENLLRSPQIATVFLDDQMRIRSFTPAISDIYGLIPTDVGRSLERFVPFVDDMPPLPDPGELTLHGSIEHKVHAHNGETYLRRVLPYRSHTGTSEGMVCTFTNVTDLTESDELFQLLVDASAQIVWVATSDGRIVDDSPSWREFTGQSFDDWKDSGWVNAIHPEDRESILIAWQRALDTLEPLNFEYRLWHRGGDYRWTHVRAVPQLNADRRVKRWIGMNSDISERKHAQLELEARERQLQTITNAIPPMIAFIDQEERYAFVNAAFAKQFGMSIEAIIGERVRDILGEETFAVVSPHLRDGLAGKPATFELSLPAPAIQVREDGESKSAESEMQFKAVAYVPEFDDKGQVEGVHVVISDITDRKRRELDLSFRAELVESFSRLATADEIADLATRKVAEHFSADRCLLAEVDLSENVAMVKHEFRKTDDLPGLIGRHTLDQYPMPDESRSSRDGQRLQIDDIGPGGRLPGKMAGFDAFGLRSFANGCYIINDNQRLTLTVLKSNPYRWKDSEIEFLDELATAIYLRLDRAQTEAELHASDNFNRTVLASSPDCVKVLDSEGRLLMMNEPGLALMEIDDFEPLLGKEWWSLWPEEHQLLVRNSLDECREHGECRFELFRSTVKGTPKWWDVVVRPIISADDRPIRYVTVSRDITEQQTKTTELAAAKSKLDLSLEVSNMAPWSWDVKNNAPILDAISKRYYGLPEDKPLTIQDVLHQIDDSHRDRVGSAILHALEVGGVYDQEYPVWLPSGKKRWVRARGQSVRKDDGTLEDFFGVVIDITDRKEHELDLAQREAHLRRVINGNIGFLVVLSPNGIVLEINATATSVVNSTRDEVVGSRFCDGYWWNHSPALQSEVQEIIARAAAGETVRRDISFRVWNDQSRIGDASFSPIFDDNGKVTHIVASGIDITDRKAAEALVVEREQRLKIALDAGQMGTFTWDAATGQVDWSDQLFAIYGCSRDFPLSMEAFRELVHPDDRDSLWSDLEEKLQSHDEVYDAEFRMVRPSDGRILWIHRRGVIRRDAKGTATSITGVVADISRRKQWELELADRESHLRRVINNQLGLVGVIDHRGILVEVDDRWLEIVRVARADVIGKHFADTPWWTYDPTVVLQMRNAMDRAFSGEVVRYDVSLFAHGDDGVMIDFMIAPVKNESGEVEFLIPSGVDIRQRKQAERDLEQRARLAELHTTLAIELTRRESMAATLHAAIERFVETLDVALVRIWLCDDSESALTLAAGGGISVHPDEEKAIIPFGEFQTGRIARDQTPVLSNEVANDARISDREWAVSQGMISFAGYPLMISGRTIGVLELFSRRQFSATEFEQLQPMSIAVAQCIERLKYAALLAENSLRFKMALRAGGMAAWEWRDDRSIWTDELYELLGVSKDQQARPELFFSLVHPDDVDHLTSAWQASIDGSHEYNTEFRIIRPDGQIRWLAGLGESIRDTDSKVVRMYGVNWDSTADHDREEALIESERRANAANAAKSAFVANMSHEIRTPMTAILGYADLVRDLIDHPEALSHLQTIRRNGDYLLDIINDILDLSKIEAGKLDLLSDRMSPHQIVEDVRSIMEVRAAEKNLQLIVKYASQIPARMYTDSRRLKQILINLVGNAIKFTTSGEVSIVIQYTNEDHQDVRQRPMNRQTVAQRSYEGGFLQFDVIDTGIGMSDEQLRNLFNPFSQGDSSVSRNFGGTGLGLAISQRLAEMLGGGITVEARINRGSKFTAKIATGDLTGVEFIDPKPVVHEANTSGSNESITLSCHILVVDDRRDIRFLSRRLLTTAGATVDECEDGQQAVDYIKQRLSTNACPALILLDMQMPNLDGYQTARQLRTLGYAGPIIALTADAMQGDMNLCREAGCNDYLAKPIDVQLLLQMVYKMTSVN